MWRLYCAALLLVGSWRAGAQALPPVGPMIVNSAVPGGEPTPKVATSAYANTLVFTGQQKVTGRLNANMPANSTLSARLTAPSGGTSVGAVNLDVVDRNLVIAATPIFFTNVTITYTFTPLVSAGVIPSTSRTVTYTLSAYP